MKALLGAPQVQLPQASLLFILLHLGQSCRSYFSTEAIEHAQRQSGASAFMLQLSSMTWVCYADGELWSNEAKGQELASSAEWGEVDFGEEVVRISAGMPVVQRMRTMSSKTMTFACLMGHSFRCGDLHRMSHPVWESTSVMHANMCTKGCCREKSTLCS